MKLFSLLAGASLLVSAGAASAFTFVTTEKPMYQMVTPGWSIRPLVTIGETLPNGFRPVGIPDGIGAYSLDNNTIRAFVVHELGRTSGSAYTLDSGFSLKGARTSFFDIDEARLSVTNAGLVCNTIIDRIGKVVVGAGQLDGDAIGRFCSAALFEANSFGPGRGLADRLSFAGEETSKGTTCTMSLGFDADGKPTAANTTIVYNGDLDATRALRSPDNLDWAGATKLLIQEDRSIAWDPAVNPNEAGMLEVDMTTGTVSRIANIDRSAVPAGQVDDNPTDFGNWESTGILDVSALFGLPLGSGFLGNVQAHSIRLGSGDLVEGGQLFILNSGVPEASTRAMLIAGFGVVGMAARRRRTALPAA